MTPLAFTHCSNKDGLNSYQVLANELRTDDFQILDLACGDGHLIQYILKNCPRASVTGLDMSDGELEIAIQAYSHHDNVRFIQSSAHESSLAKHSQDAILCHMAFMLMRPVEIVVDEIERVLKPHGRFSAIINRKEEVDPLSQEISEVIVNYFYNKFNISKLPKIASSKLSSNDGLKKIFNPKVFSEPEMINIDFHVSTTIDEALNQWKDVYFIGVLPKVNRAEVLDRIYSVIKQHSSLHSSLKGTVSYTYPLQLIRTSKIER